VQHFQATFAISVRRAAGLRGWPATTPEGIETATPTEDRHGYAPGPRGGFRNKQPDCKGTAGRQDRYASLPDVVGRFDQIDQPT